MNEKMNQSQSKEGKNVRIAKDDHKALKTLAFYEERYMADLVHEAVNHLKEKYNYNGK